MIINLLDFSNTLQLWFWAHGFESIVLVPWIWAHGLGPMVFSIFFHKKLYIYIYIYNLSYLNQIK